MFSDKIDELHGAASAALGGLNDFGKEESYLPGLTKILNSLDNDGTQFVSGSEEFIIGELVGPLISRLLTEQGWKDNPQYSQTAIRRPQIITGVPRTGTTVLHKLLSVDPQFQGIDTWLAAFPMPRPPRAQWPNNPWYQACVKGLEDFFTKVPQMRAAHDIRADDVDECLEVLKHGFCSNRFASSLRLPSYDEWMQSQNQKPHYQRFYKTLQLIGSNDTDKTWLLKNPGHITAINELLGIFPDACVIQTHRDPVKTLPSLCSVLKQARGIMQGDDVDALEIGKRELEYWSNAVSSAHIARQKAPSQFMDVLQKDLHKDPMSIIYEIYDRFDYQLNDSVKAEMLARIERNPEGSHGEHRYTLEEFGFTEQQINERFKNYIDSYIPNL